MSVQSYPQWAYCDNSSCPTLGNYTLNDGLIKKEWVNKTVNPEKLVSSYYLDWLREQDSNLQPSG